MVRMLRPLTCIAWSDATLSTRIKSHCSVGLYCCNLCEAHHWHNMSVIPCNVNGAAVVMTRDLVEVFRCFANVRARLLGFSVLLKGTELQAPDAHLAIVQDVYCERRYTPVRLRMRFRDAHTCPSRARSCLGGTVSSRVDLSSSAMSASESTSGGDYT